MTTLHSSPVVTAVTDDSVGDGDRDVITEANISEDDDDDGDGGGMMILMSNNGTAVSQRGA